MFKLVGKEHFNLGKAKCTIAIEAVSGFSYEYSLEVNGKSLKKFTENQSKISRCWTCTVQGTPIRIVLGEFQIPVTDNRKSIENIIIVYYTFF